MANITFRFNNEVLLAGEQLTGDVKIEVTKPIEFCAVEFYIIGEEGVNIHEKRTRTSNNGKTTTEHRTHHFHSKLFKYKEFLSLKPGTPGYIYEDAIPQPQPQPQQQQIPKLQVGIYILPFSVLIPRNLPPSLEITPGSCSAFVRYFATASVNTNNMFTDFWKNLNIKRHNFKVIDHYNEEVYHQNSHPQQKHTEKSFLFRSGKLKFTASIPRSSYFPGEIVPITLHITNETSKHIDDIRVGITRVVEQKPRRYGMYSKSSHAISSYSTKKEVNERSTVPVMTIEYMLSSEKPWGPSLSLKHFELSYMINVVLVPNGLACNLALEFPIVIVTPPLKLQSSNSLLNTFSPYSFPTEVMMNSNSSSSSSSISLSTTHEPPVEYDHIINEDGFVELKKIDSNNNITNNNTTTTLPTANEDSHHNHHNYYDQNNNNIPSSYSVHSPQYAPQYSLLQNTPQYVVGMNQNISSQYSAPPYHGGNLHLMIPPPPQLNEPLNYYPIMDHPSL